MTELRVRSDEFFQNQAHELRCRVCAYSERRKQTPQDLSQAGHPCPNCGSRDWRDRVVRREESDAVYLTRREREREARAEAVRADLAAERAQRRT